MYARLCESAVTQRPGAGEWPRRRHVVQAHLTLGRHVHEPAPFDPAPRERCAVEGFVSEVVPVTPLKRKMKAEFKGFILGGGRGVISLRFRFGNQNSCKRIIGEERRGEVNAVVPWLRGTFRISTFITMCANVLNFFSIWTRSTSTTSEIAVRGAGIIVASYSLRTARIFIPKSRILRLRIL